MGTVGQRRELLILHLSEFRSTGSRGSGDVSHREGPPSCSEAAKNGEVHCMQ